jgi:2-polyprenyl-3-methyl-5-hydroxy-6-metoxy-1,4-benzoquinol methylase
MTENGTIYFKDGKLIAEHGKAKVYRMNGELFLEIGPGHTLWALESELTDYIEQLQDYPRGNCLEVGLGLGVISRYMLTFPRVNKLTTIELEADVIGVHSKIKESDRGVKLDYDPSRHRILNADGLSYAYQTKQRYDFIFIDCYDRIDEETLPMILDMANACSRLMKPGARMMGWLDKHTPAQHFDIFQKIFNQY